jgi:hypothetical protein
MLRTRVTYYFYFYAVNAAGVSILSAEKECKKFREAEELRKELKTGNKKKRRK